MPRNAHGRPLLNIGPSRPPKRKPRRNAALNALETAERQNPDSVKIRQHRLGEVDNDSDGPQTRADADERSSKRRKITNEHGEDDDVDEGSDLEGGTWHTGVDEDDEDSDLDSDEAFGESDEEKFADFTFRGSESHPSVRNHTNVKKTKAISLDEDSREEKGTEDEEDPDDFGDDAVDLATAWDMDEADQVKERQKSNRKKNELRTTKELSESWSGSSNSNSEDDDSDATSGDTQSQFSVSEEDAEGDANGLRTFVEGLYSSQVTDTRRPRYDTKDLPGQPSQFGLTSAKLSAADLLQYVKDPAQRQSLKILQSAERSGPEEYKGGVPGKLTVPLAKRQQDRLDRTAAYDKSKETLNRWIDTVKQNRRADHLSFPLPDHAKDSALGQKQLMPTSQSAPANELEAKIHQIMEESGMGPKNGQSIDDQEQAFEEFAERKIDIDEVKARRADLRMARELMFREEIRAKRIKKIKSKAFRRVHRKERDRFEARQKEALEAAGLLNSDEEREKQDRRRAEERMGARHRESKWAKGVKQAGRAAWDEDARAGVSGLARRDEELRRRIMGKGVADTGMENGSESDSDYSADTEEEDEKLGHKLDMLESAEVDTSKSKLSQMAFMQRAEATRKAANDQEIRTIRSALDEGDVELDSGEEENQEPAGRQKFGVGVQTRVAPQSRKPKNEFEAHLSDEDRNDHLGLDSTPAQEDRMTRAAKVKPSAEVTKKGQNGQSSLLANSRSHTSKPKAIEKLLPERKPAIQTVMHDYTSPSESENDAQDELTREDTKAAVAASIFAGPDDVFHEFAKEKAELVEEEGDQVVDNTLPGWGSWTGVGISKREQKKGKGRFLTTTKGVAPEKRQDTKLDRVIINEKRTKKNGKYLATELPYPFENRQQYERSLRLPVGPEWSTVNHYQDSIKPRVLLKQGTVIRPIAKPIA